MKELQEDIKELLQKIIVKAYEVNENTNHTVFVEFIGHMNWLDVDIYTNGWKRSTSADIKYEADLHSEDVLEQLKEILEKLEEMEG